MRWRTSTLAGRDDVVAGAFRVLATREVHGLTLVGAEGIGKSHLARSIADRAAGDFEVRTVTATPATTDIPFGALAPYLPPDAATTGLPALLLVRAGLLGDGSPERSRPLLLVVDDAHLIDDASATVLLQLVGAGDVQLILTQRSGATAPDAVTRLWRDHLLERIDLQPLEPAAVATLAAELLGGDLDGPSAWLLGERSGGNPLYLRELVIAGKEAGEWREEVAGWRWEPGRATSPRLADLLADRVRGLSPAHREVLVHLAIGGPLTLAELADIATDEVLDDLEQAELLAVTDADGQLEVRVAHPAHADALRRGVGRLRTRAVQARLIEAILATGLSRPKDVLRVATLALEAEIDIEPDILTRAANAALLASDVSLATRLAEQAFGRSPSFQAGEVLGQALYASGDFRAIERHCEQWGPLAASDQDRATVVLLEATDHFYRRADAPAAFAALDRVASELPAGPASDELRGMRATLLMVSGEHHQALAIAEPLLAAGGPDRVLFHAALAAAQSLRCSGRPGQAVELADGVLAAAAALGPQATLVSTPVFGVVRAAALVDLGQPEAGLAAAEAARLGALRSGDVPTLGLIEMIRSEALTMLGRLADAASAARAAEVAGAELHHATFRRWAVMQRGQVAVAASDHARIHAALQDLDALGSHPARMFEHGEAIARAHLAHHQGAHDQAEAVLRSTAERLEARGELNGAARCWHALVGLGLPGAARPLEALAAAVQGELVPAMAAHATALEVADPAALGAAAERFAEMGALLLAVPAATQAADALAGAGDRRGQARWTQRAAGWAASCQALSAPEGAAPPPLVALTRREREVAHLAAEGLPARTIAERLFLSHRTVENHLARAYDKLGVRSRAELPGALALA